MRELQGLMKKQLSEITRISYGTLSDLENNVMPLNIEKAKSLAYALQCHPVILTFSGWGIEIKRAA